eukprot:g26983.t1
MFLQKYITNAIEAIRHVNGKFSSPSIRPERALLLSSALRAGLLLCVRGKFALSLTNWRDRSVDSEGLRESDPTMSGTGFRIRSGNRDCTGSGSTDRDCPRSGSTDRDCNGIRRTDRDGTGSGRTDRDCTGSGIAP